MFTHPNFANWPFVALLLLFLFAFQNGFGVIAKTFADPPLVSVSLDVVPVPGSVCEERQSANPLERWCVIELYDISRDVDGKWLGQAIDLVAASQICGGDGVGSYEATEHSLVLYLSDYVGSHCVPVPPFSVSAVRHVDEPVRFLGLQIGVMHWRLPTPIAQILE